MGEEINLDELIEQSLSQIRSKAKETERIIVVDVTVGQSVCRLWSLNKKYGIVVPKDSKVEEILKILEQGKLAIVEVEKDSLVQRRNIVRVVGAKEVPEEKLPTFTIEPDRNGIKLVGDGVVIRPDPFSFNTQRLMMRYEEGTVEVKALPVLCDSRGRCLGIQFVPLKLEKYIPLEASVTVTETVEDLLNSTERERKPEQSQQAGQKPEQKQADEGEKLELTLR